MAQERKYASWVKDLIARGIHEVELTEEDLMGHSAQPVNTVSPSAEPAPVDTRTASQKHAEAVINITQRLERAREAIKLEIEDTAHDRETQIAEIEKRYSSRVTQLKTELDDITVSIDAFRAARDQFDAAGAVAHPDAPQEADAPNIPKLTKADVLDDLPQAPNADPASVPQGKPAKS